MCVFTIKKFIINAFIVVCVETCKILLVLHFASSSGFVHIKMKCDCCVSVVVIDLKGLINHLTDVEILLVV